MPQSKESQIEMFGETIEAMDAAFARRFGSEDMYIASILSDAQEVMAHGDTEQARQFINKAKHFIFNRMEREMGRRC